MHNSMIPSNYKVSNYIPDDLGFSILSKLPLKSLKRFGSVCKSWSLLFENHIFMGTYRINFLSKNHACYDGTSLLLLQHTIYGDKQKYDLNSISGDRFENRVKLDWPDPFQENNDICFVMGTYSINGIICLYRNIYHILWNPATGEFMVIPHSSIESNPDNWVGNGIFGYDRIRDDYKVIRCAHIQQRMDDPYYLWEIYSLRRNTWKTLDVDMPWPIYYLEEVFMDGVGHWFSKLETHNELFLVSFDFSNDTFITTPLPSDMVNENYRILVVLNGSIALGISHTETNTFHISILGEVGVKNSWTKLFVFGLLHCNEYPTGAWKNGVIFVRKDNGELVWFDLSTHMIKDLGPLEGSYVRKIVIYKESLLPIGGVSD